MKIKGFDKDLKCRGFQFEIGKEYKIDTNGKPLELCSGTVFHYCDSLQKVHEYYSCDDDSNRFCEIEVLGEEVSDGEKCGSDHIRILREITGEELDVLKGLINGNTGIFNSGNLNSGNLNSGDRNSGNLNSGDLNSGDRNSGDWNSGDWNSGDQNSGDRNSGNWNSGDRNSGNRNSGNWNSGDQNSGNRNSGNWNSGDWNSGDQNSGSHNQGSYNSGNYNRGYGNSDERNSGWRNSGRRNMGDRNSGCGNVGDKNTGHDNIGSWNTGRRNRGNSNSGMFNRCSHSNGFFCTTEPTVRMFNKDTNLTYDDFLRSEWHRVLNFGLFHLTEWVTYTDAEKQADPVKELTEGYLKTRSFEEACRIWWENLSEKDKKIVQSMPNFDADVFEEITGIKLK